MVNSEVRADILSRISAAEAEHNVRVLLAIESGSRAWGFASPNSDYDVRFIYIHQRDWYLSVDLEDRRDVIEYPIVDEIDINGWDIRKALQLYWKSNPALIEWLQSPITYIEHGDFRQKMLALMPEIYALEKGMYHYLHMAKTNYRGYLREAVVPLKKYFYVLRPLLAIRWLQIRQTPAPIEFHTLLTMLNEQSVRTEIDALLAQKAVSQEKDFIAKNDTIDHFIRSEIERHESEGFSAFAAKRQPRDIAVLNDLFRTALARNQ